MEYLVWAIVGLLAYSLVAPLASDVTQEVQATPALFLATAIFLCIAAVVIALTSPVDVSYAISVEAGYVYAGGFFLTIGLLSYISALETGPVSVVVPIYGMFIVGSSVLGIVFLDETLEIEQIAGIICALIAIYLSAGEE